MRHAVISYFIAAVTGVISVFTIANDAHAADWVFTAKNVADKRISRDGLYTQLLNSPHIKAGEFFSSAIKKHARNDLNGAIADYLAALKIEDVDPAIHWYLGQAYQAAGNTDKAKQEFEIEQKMTKEPVKIQDADHRHADTGEHPVGVNDLLYAVRDGFSPICDPETNF